MLALVGSVALPPVVEAATGLLGCAVPLDRGSRDLKVFCGGRDALAVFGTPCLHRGWVQRLGSALVPAVVRCLGYFDASLLHFLPVNVVGFALSCHEGQHSVTGKIPLNSSKIPLTLRPR